MIEMQPPEIEVVDQVEMTVEHQGRMKLGWHRLDNGLHVATLSLRMSQMHSGKSASQQGGNLSPLQGHRLLGSNGYQPGGQYLFSHHRRP